MIGSILSGIADLQNSFFGIASGAVNLWQNDQMLKETQKQNEINQANWEKEFNWNDKTWNKAFDYNKLVNETNWEREDNAVQRRAADLAAAGINPMLAGLGGAQAGTGGVINPMFMGNSNTQNGVPNLDAINFGTNSNNLGKAVSELERIKSQEKLHSDDIDAKLELQKRDIEENEKSDERKFKAEKSIEQLRNINSIIRDRLNAKDEATQNALDRKLQWDIATHKAIRSIFEHSEVPMLDNAWKALFDSLTEEEFQNIRNGKFSTVLANKIKNAWQSFWQPKKNKENKEEKEIDARTRTDSDGTKRHKIW